MNLSLSQTRDAMKKSVVVIVTKFGFRKAIWVFDHEQSDAEPFVSRHKTETHTDERERERDKQCKTFQKFRHTSTNVHLNGEIDGLRLIELATLGAVKSGSNTRGCSIIRIKLQIKCRYGPLQALNRDISVRTEF